MKQMVLAIVLSLMFSGVFAAKSMSNTRSVTLDEALNNSALIGHMVEIETCAGIPVSDAPHSDNVIILFRCDATLSDPDNMKAVLGRVTASTVFKPTHGWDVGDSSTFKGRFRGVLQKETDSGADRKDLLVMDLVEVDFHASVELE